MKRISEAKYATVLLFLILSLISLNEVLAAGDSKDCKGCKDPAVFSRMPGFHIYNYRELEFDHFEFPISPGDKTNIEGRFYYADYYANDGITIPSGLQITRNYVNAAKAIGGENVYEFEDGGTQYVTLKVIKDDAEIWAFVQGSDNGMYKVNIIHKQKMKQDVIASAAVLAGNIEETGRSAVYGIYFDTDKSEIKPESEPALAEIIKMLQANPNLKVYVVGHTDNAGTFDHNLKLSQSRAGAVVSTLVKRNITASRLTPYGAGPTSPVASHKTEEGRAKNRRVELVAQ
jgi:outer membrane protein OmpA-like peptidoglycan-associated protein